MKKIIISVCLFILISCGTSAVNTEGTTKLTEGSVTVYHDDKRNVTCWIYVGYNKGGISCIPDNQLVNK